MPEMLALSATSSVGPVKPMPLDRYPSKGSWFVSTPQSEEVWNWDRGYGERHDGSLKAIHFLG